MRTLTEGEILAAFPRRHRRHVALPRDLTARMWDELDFLGWVDIGTSQGFIVTEHRGVVRGLAFRRGSPAETARRRARMCSFCKTIHGFQGVRVFSTEHPTNPNLRLADDLCDDLQCSLRARRLISLPPNQMPETIGNEERAVRLCEEVEKFFDRCYAG